MGCDIHGCYEVRRNVFMEDDPEEDLKDWMVAEEIDHRRRYRAWAAMADVRQLGESVPCPFALRGIPEDATEYNRDAHIACGLDAHSATWLTLPELISLSNETVQPYIDRMRTLRDFYSVKDEDIRIVCWFDN